MFSWSDETWFPDWHCPSFQTIHQLQIEKFLCSQIGTCKNGKDGTCILSFKFAPMFRTNIHFSMQHFSSEHANSNHVRELANRISVALNVCIQVLLNVCILRIFLMYIIWRYRFRDEVSSPFKACFQPCTLYMHLKSLPCVLSAFSLVSLFFSPNALPEEQPHSSSQCAPLNCLSKPPPYP